MLATQAISRGAGSGAFNFDGGTLQPIADNALFISGLTAATVMAGGAVIDTNGFNVTIPQSLVHNTAGPALDGGLDKNGTGTLVLSGPTLSYTGATDVNGGTLRLQSRLGTGANVVNANASLFIEANQTFAALNIGASGVVTLADAPMPGALAVQAVPEPGALSLLAFAACGLLGRRRRA